MSGPKDRILVNELFFLELSPRPGGDCITWLIEQSCGVDMLRLALDVAEGLPPAIPPPENWERLVGVRFHADRPGSLQAIRSAFRGLEKSIRSQLWLRHTGDMITLPPQDYNSWFLGHVIFAPKPGEDVKNQVRDLIQSVDVKIS